MSLLKVGVKTEANWEFVYGFLKILDARIADSSQIEILGKIFLRLFYAAVDVIVSLFPILKVNVNDCSMIEQIWTIGIQATSFLHLFQSLNQNFGSFNLIFAFAVVELMNEGHCGVNIRLYFLRIDICSLFEFIYAILEPVLLIR